MKYGFIYWIKGNLYGTLVVRDSAAGANSERLRIGRIVKMTGDPPTPSPDGKYKYEVSAVVEIP